MSDVQFIWLIFFDILDICSISNNSIKFFRMLFIISNFIFGDYIIEEVELCCYR